MPAPSSFASPRPAPHSGAFSLSMPARLISNSPSPSAFARVRPLRPAEADDEVVRHRAGHIIAVEDLEVGIKSCVVSHSRLVEEGGLQVQIARGIWCGPCCAEQFANGIVVGAGIIAGHHRRTT